MLSLMLLAAHMVGDYIAQTDWMAANKLKDWKVRAIHVTVYSGCFIPLLFYSNIALVRFCVFMVLLWISHFITDSRRWASGEKWPPKPILVDQSIHIATLACLGLLLDG